MNFASISPAALSRAMMTLRRAGRSVKPVPDRLGYFFVDDFVKDAEAILKELEVVARH